MRHPHESPGLDAQSCATVPTELWQFGEQGACGYSANADLDMGASGFNYANHCLVIVSKP